MRKYIFNGAVLGALFGAVNLTRTTAKGPRDWRLILMWVSWIISLVVAIGTVAKESRDRQIAQK